MKYQYINKYIYFKFSTDMLKKNLQAQMRFVLIMDPPAELVVRKLQIDLVC